MIVSKLRTNIQEVVKYQMPALNTTLKHTLKELFYIIEIYLIEKVFQIKKYVYCDL